MLNSAKHESFSANKYVNANIVGNFIFISREIFNSAVLSKKELAIVGNLEFNSRTNFMLSWVELVWATGAGDVFQCAEPCPCGWGVQWRVSSEGLCSPRLSTQPAALHHCAWSLVTQVPLWGPLGGPLCRWPCYHRWIAQGMCQEALDLERSKGGEGLRVNAGKTKIMICGMGMDRLQGSGEFPCAICHTGVGSNSIFCICCKHWVHKKCSGQALDKGLWLQLYMVPGNCTPLGWQTIEGSPSRTWQAGGGSFLLLPTALVCGAQCSMPVRLGQWQSQTSNICNGMTAMIRQICNVKPQDIVTTRSNELLALGIEDLDFILKERWFSWYGHVKRSNGAFGMHVDGKCGPVRPKMTWKQLTERDCREWKLSAIDPSPGDLVWDLPCLQQASYLEGGPLMWMLPCTYDDDEGIAKCHFIVGKAGQLVN